MRKFTLLVFAIALSFTFVNAQTVVLTEDFEGSGLPTGWTKTQNSPSVGFEFGASLGSAYFTIPAHTKYAASNDDQHDNSSTTANLADMDRLITPALDLTPFASSGVVIDFDYVQPGTYGSSGSIEVSTDGGSTWASVSTLTNATQWTGATVDLSAFTASSAALVAFRHNDGGGWADGLAVDDVVVREVPGYDAAMEEIGVGNYVAQGNVNITGSFANQGFQTITSLDVTYSVNGGAPVTANLTGLNVPLGSNASFTHTTPYNFAATGIYALKVWVSNPNGNTDAVGFNDTLTKDVSVLSSIPVKSAILEDHTGAWCQFCPDGTVISEQVNANYGAQSIVLAVHNNDRMSTAEGDLIANEYISGFPGGTVDHYKFADEAAVELNRGQWDSRVAERLGHVVPVSASFENVAFNAATREITATVRADFFGEAGGDLRINCIVVEDSVVGTGTGYDQVNFYNTQTGHPFAGAGNPIIGFVHDHTARAFLGGAWGMSGVIPGTVGDGDAFTQTFSYTLPADYNEAHVKLVAVVQKYSNDPEDREIMNSEQVSLSTFVATDDQVDIATAVNAYPNPFSSYTNIEFSLEVNSEVQVTVMDLYGKQIATLTNGFMNQGIHTVRWNGTTGNGSLATNGVYLISVKAGDQAKVQKVILNR